MRGIMVTLNVLRIPVAIFVLIGLAGIFFTGAEGEFANVIKLIASGIIMNGAALIVLIWIWRRIQARRSPQHLNESDM